VADAIATCRQAGIRLAMITGDSAATAAAIATEIGLLGPHGTVVEGKDLPVTDEAVAKLLDREDGAVVARVTPADKLRIARALRSRGHVVAMTGDGVNDAMAIKDADLGIAMGSGTSASKAVARLVLLDNEFSRLPNVLGYGRQVIANVERVANLFLAKTVYGIAFAVVFALLLWEFPFLPRQLTLVSTLTIGIPSFFLALAPNRRIYHPGILQRLLRYAVPTGLIAAVVTIGANAVLRGITDGEQVRAITTVALWITAFWILCVLTRPLDRWRALLLAAMVAAFVLAITVPFGREFFAMPLRVEPPLLVGVAAGVLGAVAVEIFYRFARRRSLIYDRV